MNFFKKMLITFTAIVCCVFNLGSFTIVAQEEGVPMYRLYNPYSGEHLYTANYEEKEHLGQIDWQYEGIGWIAPSTSSHPVYRLYNPYSGDHLYTLKISERDDLVRIGWRDEGIGFYSDNQQRVPLYRQFNPYAQTGTHNYTISKEENDNLVRIGWNAEGIGWYGIGKSDEQNQIGFLHTDNNRIVDELGNPFIIRGISTHGIAWFPQIINSKSFSNFKYEFGLNTVRLAMYTAEYGGYCTGGNQSHLESLIDEGIRLCQARNMYCIIDWHILSDSNPLQHVNEAKAFFRKMAQKYGSLPNIIFEICNEPNGGTNWNQITQYADEVIPVIRQNSNNLILVGTPNWSQNVEDPANAPLPYDNVAYTLHFYAATHKEDLRRRLETVADRIPIVVSEYGLCDASGNGAIDEASANEWMEVLNKYQIGRVLWNASNKNESSSILKPGTNMEHWWINDLTQSGMWLLKQQNILIPDNPVEPETPINPAQLSMSLTKTNGWEENNSYMTQFIGTINNKGGQASKSWEFTLTFPEAISISNHWNCNINKISENTIKITSADYNSVIEGEQTISDIGLIVKCSSQLESASIKIQ